jgi:AcrR family transcriptional regulator
MPKTALQKAREAPQSAKGRILSAAEAIFARKGFAGASTREIAAAAGVNISSLHYHWESKETLYLSVFQNIYDQILGLVRRSLPEKAGEVLDRGPMNQTMGALFDFFADHPNVPKLLVRRLVEVEETGVEVERDVLVPAWKMFANWMAEIGGPKLRDVDVQVFMLNVYSVLLLFLLDSPQYVSILGGSIREMGIRRRLRRHILALVPLLLQGTRNED